MYQCTNVVFSLLSSCSRSRETVPYTTLRGRTPQETAIQLVWTGWFRVNHGNWCDIGNTLLAAYMSRHLPWLLRWASRVENGSLNI